ncbi:MAG TPA: hypothetical protein VFM18_13885, partial [Methanosarcina sp.]|nr:hypothetical protein [Methanosarcina sp.]
MSYPSMSRITPEEYQDRLTNVYGHNTSVSCCCKGLLDGTKEVIELLNKDSDTRLADLILELGGVIAS